MLFFLSCITSQVTRNGTRLITGLISIRLHRIGALTLTFIHWASTLEPNDNWVEKKITEQRRV